jgi:hypothetical protein
MKKIASVVSFALAAVSLVAGCSVDAGDGAALDESVGLEEGGLCSNPDGINAMMASLATVIGNELHRFEIANDFEIYRGYNNNEMLRIKSSARSLCSNNCRNIDAILLWQDSRNDQKFVFKDGTKLNSWVFASRLVAGWRAQKNCQDRAYNGDLSACVAEPHYLEKVSEAPALCNGVDYGLLLTKFKVSKATTAGVKVSPETALTNPDKLQRKFLWTDPDQTLPATGNPYLQFQILSNRVELEMDPGEGTGEAPIPPGTCPTALMKYSPTSIAGSCCSYNGGTNMAYKAQTAAGWYKCEAK